MDDALRERVEALERAVTDGDHDLSGFADEAAALDRLDDLESRMDTVEEQVEELEAATQALRGYVGNVRSVNTDVEQRADAALAKAESLERKLSAAGGDTPSVSTSSQNEADGGAGEAVDTASGAAHSGKSGGSGDEPDGQYGTDKRRNQHSPAGNRAFRVGESTRAAADGSAVSTGSHPSADGQQSEHCESCGRPREPTDDIDQTGAAPTTTRETAATGDGPDAETATQYSDASKPKQDGGQRVTTEQSASLTDTRNPAGDSTTGQRTAGTAAQRSRDSPGPDAVPTVESLAAEPPSDTAGDDPDPLPDGEDDPLVGATEGAEEAGTLQRIRDLL